MKQNTDLYWINAVKGMCMMAVFYVHTLLLCGPRLEFASPTIHAFYVNGFFFISGYLLFRKQLSSPTIDQSFTDYLTNGGRQLLENIVFRIIIPSVVFAAFFYLPAKIVKVENMSLNDFLLETFGGRTFWFTSALVVAELVILSLLATRKKSIWFYVMCIIPIIVFGWRMIYNSPETYANDLWAWRRGILSLIFVGFGGLYWKYEQFIDKWLLNWVSFAGLYIIMYIIIKYLGDEDTMLISMLTLTPLGIIPGVISVLLLIKLCKIMPYSNLLNFIGRNSIGFFFLCSGIPMIFSKLFHLVIPGEPIWGLVLVFFMSIIITYILVDVITRIFPWLFDLRQISQIKK